MKRIPTIQYLCSIWLDDKGNTSFTEIDEYISNNPNWYKENPDFTIITNITRIANLNPKNFTTYDYRITRAKILINHLKLKLFLQENQ